MVFLTNYKKFLLITALLLIFSVAFYNKALAYHGPEVWGSISSGSVYPDGSTQYNLRVMSDAHYGLGASDTKEIYLLMNGASQYGGQYRGLLVWNADGNTYSGNKDNMECGGLGGYAAIMSTAPDNVYGHQYIELDDCYTSGVGDLLTLFYTVHFNPVFMTDGPATGNGFSVKVFERTYDYITDWLDFTDIFDLDTMLPPTKPTISGVTSGDISTNYTFTLVATQADDQHLRYGLDWDLDGKADEWVPPGETYVDSGTPQDVTHSWITTGDQTFQATAQSDWGPDSIWERHTTTISSGPLDGVCGTANKVYPTGATSYGTDTYCAIGSPSSTPDFPAVGSSENWICRGVSGGADSDICEASVNSGEYSVEVSSGPVYGGIIRSEDNTIDCGVICSALFNNGDTVTLSAVPSSSNWRFTGWSGGGCTGTGLCIINVTLDTIINALFSPRAFQQIEF
jgi:hypothetical protein